MCAALQCCTLVSPVFSSSSSACNPSDGVTNRYMLPARRANRVLQKECYLLKIIFIYFCICLGPASGRRTSKKDYKADIPLYVSLTTSPQRLPKLGPALKSILNQQLKPDAIYLNLPHVFRRTNSTYNLTEVPQLPGAGLLRVLRCRDHGERAAPKE